MNVSNKTTNATIKQVWKKMQQFRTFEYDKTYSYNSHKPPRHTIIDQNDRGYKEEGKEKQFKKMQNKPSVFSDYYNNDIRSEIKGQKLVSFLSYQVILKMWKKEERRIKIIQYVTIVVKSLTVPINLGYIQIRCTVVVIHFTKLK